MEISDNDLPEENVIMQGLHSATEEMFVMERRKYYKVLYKILLLFVFMIVCAVVFIDYTFGYLFYGINVGLFVWSVLIFQTLYKIKQEQQKIIKNQQIYEKELHGHIKHNRKKTIRINTEIR